MREYAPSPAVQTFCARLSKLDAGDRARLKRNAGKPLADAHHAALGLFFSLLPKGVAVADEETFFLVATLYPLVDSGNSGDLGAALHRARQDNNAKGLDRRLEILLDADAAQLPFRLRQAVSLLHAQRVPVEWPRLLADLSNWSHPDRPVQRRWARSYFAVVGG